MPTKTVEVNAAKDHLPELLAMVAEGAEIGLTQNKTPLARLVPITSLKTTRVAGSHKNAMVASPDFDAPLPDDY
jgi:antitoxin (DNA-binding transcriptional repressor) of toxin-antitoxin stability system